MSKYPNSVTLNKNERKRPDKNDPDYEGSAEVNGTAYWLAAWVKAGPSGKFLSISFKPKEKQEAPKSTEEPAFDDDLPF